MTAIEITSFGAPEVLKPVERPKPVAQVNELIIRVEAAGVSGADLLQRQGKYPPPPGASDIPGLDVAGTVDSVGEGVQDWKPGDFVCALVTGGGYAEYCAAPTQQVLPIPEGWTPVEAVTLPENGFTVYDNLITRAALKGGETILVHGGASGIGSMAIMIGVAWGAQVIATAGSEAKCNACLRFGAQHAINYKKVEFVTEVKRVTEGHGADVILDLVGGSYLERNLETLASEGRLVIIAMQGGRTAQFDIAKLMIKRGRILGSTMRVRTPEQKGVIAQHMLKEVWPMLPAKRIIRPVVDSTFPLADARVAHERLESGVHIGKIVLVP